MSDWMIIKVVWTCPSTQLYVSQSLLLFLLPLASRRSVRNSSSNTICVSKYYIHTHTLHTPTFQVTCSNRQWWLMKNACAHYRHRQRWSRRTNACVKKQGSVCVCVWEREIERGYSLCLSNNLCSKLVFWLYHSFSFHSSLTSISLTTLPSWMDI